MQPNEDDSHQVNTSTVFNGLIFDFTNWVRQNKPLTVLAAQPHGSVFISGLKWGQGLYMPEKPLGKQGYSWITGVFLFAIMQ